MLRRLSAGLLATAAFVAPLPAIAQEGSAGDLGVMSISLKDVVKPTFGFQGALQGSGTPNQAGIGGFLPLSVGDNSVWFVDALANVNFADRKGESSIINTDVAGTTISITCIHRAAVITSIQSIHPAAVAVQPAIAKP